MLYNCHFQYSILVISIDVSTLLSGGVQLTVPELTATLLVLMCIASMVGVVVVLAVIVGKRKQAHGRKQLVNTTSQHSSTQTAR